MRKISEIPSPALAGVIRERSVLAAIAEAKNCMYDGADMLDLHLSCLDDMSVDSVKRIVKSTKLPILALNYNTRYDWSECGFTEQERVNSFLDAVSAGVAAIDMQGYTFDAKSRKEFHGEDKYSFTKGNPREIVMDSEIISKQCELIEKVHSMGAEVLLSCHPAIVMNSTQVVDLALFLEQRSPDVIKIVTLATNEDELFESIKAMRMLKKEVKTPVAYHANGAAGMLSRVMNPVLGGHIMFCVDHYNEGSTMEQVDLRNARLAVESLKKLM